MAWGALWQNDVGRAFAGYAPLLDTLGYICREERNLVNLANAFSAPGPPGLQRAWEVLEGVLDSVITRERNEKFLPALAGQNWPQPPDWLYDKYEQYLYVTQWVCNTRYQLNNRGQMLPAGERPTGCRSSYCAHASFC